MTAQFPKSPVSDPIWENAPCGLVVTETDGMIIRCNKTFSEWTGFRREEAGRAVRLTDYLTPGGKIFFEIRHIPMLNLQGSVNENRYDFIWQDGSIHPVVINSNIQETSEESRKYIFAIFPAAERTRFEQELLAHKKRLEQQLRERAGYISTLSHEIRTPLQIINGVIELLNTTGTDTKQREYIHILKNSSNTLLKLANDLLNLNKLETGNMVLSQEPFSLSKLLLETKALYSFPAEEKGLQLKCRIAETIPELVIGDPIKIKQVIDNLLANAIKFTREGEVELILESQEITSRTYSFTLMVKDTGEGIAADRIEKIFDPYVQANETIQNQFGGTGLGLDIARRIIELYGSSLQVKSSTSGTTFSFELTLARQTNPRPVEDMNRIEYHFPRTRVLIADDHEVNLRILSLVLEAKGITVEKAGNGIEAWNKICNTGFDLLLADLQMPILDGTGLLKKIRTSENRKIKNLPVVAVSGDHLFDFEKAKREDGLSAFLLKPYTNQQLDDILMMHLPIAQKGGEIEAEQAANTKLVSFDKIKAITRANPENYRMILGETVKVLRSDKEKLELAFKDRDIQKVKSLVHKNKSIINYYKADELQEKFEQGVLLLSNTTAGDDDLRKATMAINQEIDLVIGAFTKELNELK